MAQLQRMDARLDTLFTELYQVNVRVSRIAWRQVALHLSLLLHHLIQLLSILMLKNDDDDDGDDDDTSNNDGDAFSTDEMSTWHSTFCHSWQK